MKARFKKPFLHMFIALAACVTLMCGVPLAAQEPGTETATADEQVDLTVLVQEDAGIEAVYQAQAESQIRHEPNKTAEEQVRDFAKAKKFPTRWDKEKQRMFVVSFAEFATEDPVSDPHFFDKRELTAKQAVLVAKRNIIENIYTKMTAREQLIIPESDLNQQLSNEHDYAEATIKRQRLQVAKLLKESNAAEAERLREATTMDQIHALMDAAIKKLDGDYDAASIEQVKKDEYEKARTSYQEAVVKLAEVEKETERLKGQITRNMTSDVSKYAAMPLVGATVITQSESWDEDEGTYQVAVLVCWSAGLEKAARAALTGEPLRVSSRNSTKVSIDDWLAKQNLSAMIGPRQYLDNEGRRHFIGIAASDLGRTSTQRQINRERAELSASQMAVFSLFSDIDAFREAKSIMQSKSDGGLDSKESTVVAKSFALNISQEIKDLSIRGLGEITSEVTTHPLSGRKMRVTVWGLDPVSAASAMQIERSSMLAAIAVNKNQAFQKGRRAAWQEDVDRSKNDRDSYEAGREAKLVGDKVEDKNAKPRKGTKPGQKKKKAKSGSVTGDKDVDDDF